MIMTMTAPWKITNDINPTMIIIYFNIQHILQELKHSSLLLMILEGKSYYCNQCEQYIDWTK